MKRNKPPGNYNITAYILKDGGEPIVQMFTNMFNMCLREDKLPNSWENASVSMHQKGDTADIKETTDRCCSSIVSDDDYNFSSMMMMMMMMSYLVDPLGAEVANQSKSGLQHSSTLGAWVCRAG